MGNSDEHDHAAEHAGAGIGLPATSIKLSWGADLDLGEVVLLIRGLKALGDKEICEGCKTEVAALAYKLGLATHLPVIPT
jgi:hypothetical protein